LRIVPGILLPGPSWRSALVVIVLASSLVLFVRQWRKRSRLDLAVFVAAVLLLFTGCLAPTHIPGWHYFGARFLPLGVAAAVALVPIERLSRQRRRVAEVACLVAALACLWSSSRLHRRLYDGCRDPLSGLQQSFRRHAVQLPVSFHSYCGVDEAPERSEIPYLNPLLHAGALYAVAHGGSIPWVFGGIPAVHALSVRMPPIVPIPPDYMLFMSVNPELERDPRQRRAVVTDVAAWGMFYENIVAFGTRPEDRSLLVARGYRAEWEQGSLFIAAFDPCDVDLVVTSGVREDLEVSFGAWGLREIDRMRVPAERVDPASATRVEFSPLCGDLWVVVTSVGSGAKCRQAREDGKMRVTASRPRTEVVCDLGM
jgi:hypothetical protein